MKSKAYHKKLNLNKKTIANLKTEAMKNVYGGIKKPFTWTCPSVCSMAGPCC
jgi:hypothetical protein